MSTPIPAPTEQGVYWAKTKGTIGYEYIAFVYGPFSFFGVKFVNAYDGSTPDFQPFLSSIEFGPRFENPPVKI